MSSPSQKVPIRCPNCQFDGRVRADLINRRISCKRCQHIFRATIVEEDSATIMHPFVSDSAEVNQLAQPLGMAHPATSPRPAPPAPLAYGADIENLRVELAETQKHHQEDIRRLHRSLEQMLKYQDRVKELEEQVAHFQKLAQAAPAAPQDGALAAEAEGLRAELRGLQESRSRLESELQEARSQDEANRSEVASLREQVESLRRAAEAAEGTYADSARAAAEIDELRDIAAELREQLANAEAARGESDRAVQELRDQLNQALNAPAPVAGPDPAELAEAVAERDRLRDELGRARAELQTALESAPAPSVGADPAELDEARRQVEDLRAELARERDAAQSQQETVRAELVAVRSDLDRRQAEADALRQERDALVAQRDDSLRADREGDQSMLDEISELKRRCDDLVADADRARVASQEAEQRLRTELASAVEERDTLRAELNLTTASSLESAQKHQAELSSINDRLQAELAGLRQERDSLLAERDQLSASQHEAERRFRTELEELRGSRETLLAEREQLLANNRDAERRRQSEIAAQKLERDGLVAERDQALASAQEYDRRAVEATARLQALEAEMAAIRGERDAARSGQSEELAAALGQVKSLDAELKAARSELEQLRQAQAAASAGDDERTIVDRPVLGFGAGDDSGAELLRKIQELTEERDKLKAELSRNHSSKIAWADFENRLSETQEKLKKANERCKLYEDEARSAREQLIATQKGVPIKQVDVPTGLPNDTTATSFNIRIVREQRPLSWPEAQARLAIVRQLAAERKDRALLDRINKTAEKVQADIQNRNATLAETNVRAMEIELGLDPGGWSIGGLKIFRPSQSMLSSLSALTPTLEHEMRQNNLPGILTTLEEMRKVLHEQAGLPEIRRPGRKPTSMRSASESEAVKLFTSALESEQWLMRPINEKRSLPDTTLTTYACLIEACSDVRPLVERLAPEKVATIDKVVDACSTAMTRLQLNDGHLPFLDPRGKNTRFAAIVEAMVSARPDAVNAKGWVVGVDPAGLAQFETGFCGIALFRASTLTGRKDWNQAAVKAADWIQGQPCLPNYRANAVAIGLLAQAYRATRNDKYRTALIGKLTIGLLPSQVENGRWIDASDAQTTNHLLIIRALQEARAILGEEKVGPISQLDQSLDRAIASLLDEVKVLGVPAQGGALRELIRQRELFPDQAESLRSAIEASATVVQDLCYENGRAKLGVAPDQLAALVKASRA